MSWLVLIFIVPLSWYIGFRIGWRAGSTNARMVVLREIGRLKARSPQ